MTARALVVFVMVQVVPHAAAVAKRFLLDFWPYIHEPLVDEAARAPETSGFAVGRGVVVQASSLGQASPSGGALHLRTSTAPSRND